MYTSNGVGGQGVRGSGGLGVWGWGSGESGDNAMNTSISAGQKC